MIVDGPPVIQFSHFSVKEYLTSTRIAEGHVSRYYIPLEPAHLLVIQACLSILLRLDEHVTKESIEEFPLARYAAQYGADYAEFGDILSHTSTEDMIEQLFSPENHHFANWVWIYDTFSNGPVDSEAPSRPLMAPLHYAARHGLHRAAHHCMLPRYKHVRFRLLDPAAYCIRIRVVQGSMSTLLMFSTNGLHCTLSHHLRSITSLRSLDYYSSLAPMRIPKLTWA